MDNQLYNNNGLSLTIMTKKKCIFFFRINLANADHGAL